MLRTAAAFVFVSLHARGVELAAQEGFLAHIEIMQQAADTLAELCLKILCRRYECRDFHAGSNGMRNIETEQAIDNRRPHGRVCIERKIGGTAIGAADSCTAALSIARHRLPAWNR